MKFNLNKWGRKEYDKFLLFLEKNKDSSYQKFQTRLIPTKYPLLGVRMPVLRTIAKQIVEGNYNEFIKYNNHKYFEEVMIHGLAISYLNNIEEIELLLNEFLPIIDNWSITDSVCSSLKIFKKEPQYGFKLINNYILSEDPFTVRFGLVLLLNYYINDDYINDVIRIMKKINNNSYYVMMANAWLISMCYIKYPKLIISLLNDNIDLTTKKKAISKIKDSYQVSKAEKEKLSNFLS